MANLNIHHLLPKLDELRISMACENGPDVLGICETFLNSNVLTVNGFDHVRKDRSVTQEKSGGGVILYFRNNINCKHRPEFELSKLETIWAEITLPNSKPLINSENNNLVGFTMQLPAICKIWIKSAT